MAVVDEIHERSIDSDFLLIVLRKLLARKPTLKLVLMSATLNSELFAGYFGKQRPQPPCATRDPNSTCHPSCFV